MPGALDGINVIDLTNYLAGPYCTMMLGDMGAEVIKIEMPNSGDDSRRIGPPFVDGESTYFLSINRNKKSLTLDLKSEEGRIILYDLVRKADVVVENFRPGVADKLGVDFQRLTGINPKIVYCSISGFGQDGPYRDRVAYDLIVLGLGGVLSLTGQEDGPPIKPGIGFGDIIAGMFAAYGILAALLARHRVGTGQYVDVSLLDGQIAMLGYQAHILFATGKSPHRMGNAHPTVVPYGVYATRDSHVTLAVANDRIWERLCRSLGLTKLLSDPKFRTNADRQKNRIQVDRTLAEKFAGMTTAETLEILEREGVPSGPILSLDQVFIDPQVLHRKMVVEVTHTKLGRIKVLGVPIKLSATPGGISCPPPLLGEHTEEILKTMGYSKVKIRDLKAHGLT